MHHGSEPDPAILKALEKLYQQEFKRPDFGATGNFPEGKLTPSDEGEIRFGIAAYGGKVVIQFGKPTAWIGMSAEQARQLAESLMEKAGEIERGAVR